MRVLVTGGTGFLGGFLVRRLLAERVEVRLLVRPTSHLQAGVESATELAQGDLRDEESLARAVKDMEVVYHCAARVDTPGTKSEFFECNVTGTENLLKVSLRSGVRRFVYVSSLGVYNRPSRDQCIDEDTPFDDGPELRGHYAHTKILADRLAQSFAQKTGLPVRILRPGLIYGPGRDLPAGLFAFHKGRWCIVVGRRDCLLPLNYVENTVDALFLAARLDKGGLVHFNLIDDEELTLGRYHEIRSRIDRTRALFVPGWPFHLAAPVAQWLGHVLPNERLANLSRHQIERTLQSVRYDTRRIRRELGWQPQVPLERALLGIQRSASSFERRE